MHNSILQYKIYSHDVPTSSDTYPNLFRCSGIARNIAIYKMNKQPVQNNILESTLLVQQAFKNNLN